MGSPVHVFSNNAMRGQQALLRRGVGVGYKKPDTVHFIELRKRCQRFNDHRCKLVEVAD